MDIITDTHEDELIAALRAALETTGAEENEPNTITSAEFGEALGMSKSTGAQRLKRLLAAGVVEAAMVRRTNPWGHTRTVPGYRLASIGNDSQYRP